MTNPDNIVRVRARNGGRASVYEANGWCQAYGSGILDGTGVVQNTSANMTVLVGGSSSKPDVLIAENPSGYKIALDLVGQQPVTITAPASNSRISAIVAYTDDLALESTEDTVTGSPASCGLIVVNGSSSASPSAPTDTQIRSAITSDGATGSQASYAIIATIRVASNTTSITNALITRNQAGVQSSKIDFKTLWTNPAPTTPYPGGIISLSDNLSNYSFIEMVYYASDAAHYVLSSGKIETGNSFRIISVTGNGFSWRNINTNSASTGFNIEVSNASTESSSTEPGFAIPIKLIGYR